MLITVLHGACCLLGQEDFITEIRYEAAVTSSTILAKTSRLLRKLFWFSSATSFFLKKTSRKAAPAIKKALPMKP